MALASFWFFLAFIDIIKLKVRCHFMNWKDEWERFTSDPFGRFAVGLTICLGILSIFYLAFVLSL